jgi:NADH-quinone oxidoreductase subunit N
MVYGMSFLYGMTGQVGLAELGGAVGNALASGAGTAPVMVALLVMILAGFSYKIAAAPFHFWCPDVYEGAPTPVTAFFSVGPKMAGFAALIRFLHGVGAGGTIPFEQFPWPLVIAVVCVATMTIGNFAALQQRNLKRLFAYSSIAHAGYLLMGVALSNAVGTQAVLFYLVVYLFMNLGAFICVIALEERFGITDVAGCRGFGWRNPFLGVSMTVFLFSLTGIPPVAGFVGKVMLFQALVKVGGMRPLEAAWPWYALAVIGVLNSVVSLFYYARIFKAMYLEDRPKEAAPAVLPAYYAVLVWLCLVPTLALGVYFGPLMELTERATRFLNW